MTTRKRKSLKRAYKECQTLYDEDMFEPQHADVRYWFGYINRSMFRNSLSFPNVIEIKRIKDYGQAFGAEINDIMNTKIRIRNRFYDINQRKLKASAMQMFINTLAHEMIHIWQYQNFRQMNHDFTFKKWKQKFQKIGILV